MAEYVDRGALLKDIEDSVLFTVKSGQPSLEIRGANKITARIMAAPAADVAEVRHGEWVYDTNGNDWGIGAWVCSLCHAKNDNLGIGKGINPYLFAGSHYCPNCGAKMDGKGENK